MSSMDSSVGAPRRALSWRAIVVAMLVGVFVGAITPGLLVQRDTAHAQEQSKGSDSRAASFALEVDGFQDPVHFSELVAIVWEFGKPASKRSVG